jgi:hypothetical protein
MHRLLFAALMAVAIPLQAQTICGPNGCYTPSSRSPRVQVTVRGSRDYSRYASFCKVWFHAPTEHTIEARAATPVPRKAMKRWC